MEDVTSKKRVREEEADGFELTFDSTSSLRILVDVVASLLSRAEFHVSRMEGGDGLLTVEAIDPKKVCYVVAHLQCGLGKYAGSPCFTVNTDDLSKCLKTVPQHYAVSISDAINSVQMRAYEALSGASYMMNFDISTMVSDEKSVKLMQQDYDHEIEMDTGTLRNIVKNCISLRGTDLTMKVQNKKTSEKSSHMILTISAEGTTVKQEHVFHSKRVWREDGSSVIQTEHETAVSPSKDCEFEVCFEECYSAQYLSLFLKNLDRHALTMRLQKNKPLILTFPLGGRDGSFVSLVLAPRSDV